MQVEVDLKRMQTNFGGRGLSSFGDIATFKFAKFSFRTMVVIKLIQMESAQKYYASRN